MTRISRIAAIGLIFSAALLSAPSQGPAQTASQAISPFVTAAIKDLEVDRAAAVARIAQCEATISQSQAIVSAARAKGNARAEEIATAALRNAEEARRRNKQIVKSIDTSLANFKQASPNSLTDKERERARVRIAELREEVKRLQGHLRACMDETVKTFAEREALEKKISGAYEQCWTILKEDLFTEVGTAGLGKIFELRAKNIDEVTAQARKIMLETPDVNRKSQLLGFIEARQRDAALWEYNGSLVQHMGELSTAHSVYTWDKEQAPDKEKFTEGLDLLAGVIIPNYGLAKINVVAVASVAAELKAWYKLKEIDKQNAGCSREVKSLSFRMEHRMGEINCLDACLDQPAEGCVDRCRGKTSLATPPPLPE